jgi:hypothetical protein
MATSPAFIQLLTLANNEQRTFEQLKEIIQQNGLCSALVGSVENLQGNFYASFAQACSVVLGNSQYISSMLIEKQEQTGKLCGLGLASIDQYDLFTIASLDDNAVKKVQALIELINPQEDFYHKMLATHIVRNDVDDFNKYGYLPEKTFIPVQELERIANNFDPENIVLKDFYVMDAETSAYRGFKPLEMIIYPIVIKELIHSLLAINGKYLTHNEMDELNEQLFVYNGHTKMLNDIEFHGIKLERNIEAKEINLKLPTEIVEKLKDMRLHILDYQHFFY